MSREEKFITIIDMLNISNKSNISNINKNLLSYNFPKKSWLTEQYSKNKYASYKPFQFVDGEGVRCSIYLSGCLFGCHECFNESIQNFNIGYFYNEEIEERIINDLSANYVQGLTILGGEPFLNTTVALKLCTRVRKEFGNKKDIWIYSGYTYEQLLEDSSDKIELLELCDVLVDGPFINDLKDLTLAFRGSKNQRIIDIKKSKIDNIVLYIE